MTAEINQHPVVQDTKHDAAIQSNAAGAKMLSSQEGNPGRSAVNEAQSRGIESAQNLLDKHIGTPEITGLNQASANRPTDVHNSTEKPAGTDKTDAPGEHQEGGALAVAKAIAGGAVDEVIHHPGRVLGNMAIGAAIGVGLAAVGPEVALAAGVGAVGLGLWEGAKHLGGWSHSADVTANPDKHSAKEVEDAKKDLGGIGAGAVDAVAGLAGGYLGARTAIAARSAISNALDSGSPSGAASESAAATLPAESSNLPASIPADKAPVMPQASEQPTIVQPQRPQAAGTDKGTGSDKNAGQSRESSSGDTNTPAPQAKADVDWSDKSYTVGGEKHQFMGRNDDLYMYGKQPDTSENVGPVKLHIESPNADHTKKLQESVIAELQKPEIDGKVVAWKTTNGERLAAEEEAGNGGTGQNAKAFTLYFENAKDAAFVKNALDKRISHDGLGFDKPLPTGNIGTIDGSSNIVQTVRDTFPRAEMPDRHNGVALGQQITRQAEQEFRAKPGGMSETQFRALERKTGMEPYSLGYDRKTNQIALRNPEGESRGKGMSYVPESTRETNGSNSRRALYDLFNRYHLDPADSE